MEAMSVRPVQGTAKSAVERSHQRDMWGGELPGHMTCSALPWVSAVCAASSWSPASPGQDTGLDVP